jgi:hypothetical protein
LKEGAKPTNKAGRQECDSVLALASASESAELTPPYVRNEIQQQHQAEDERKPKPGEQPPKSGEHCPEQRVQQKVKRRLPPNDPKRLEDFALNPVYALTGVPTGEL